MRTTKFCCLRRNVETSCHKQNSLTRGAASSDVRLPRSTNVAAKCYNLYSTKSTVKMLTTLDGPAVLMQKPRKPIGRKSVYNLQDNLPDEASPGDWLGLRSPADLNSPINDSSFCSLSKWFLDMFSDDEQTMSLSSLFHVLMTLSLNKCWRRSVLTRFLPYNVWYGKNYGMVWLLDSGKKIEDIGYVYSFRQNTRT